MGGVADASGSAAALLDVVADAFGSPLGACCTRGSAAAEASRGGGTDGASPLATLAAAATHAKHLRALAVLFFWLLLNWSGANSAWQTEHRMAARTARLRQNRWVHSTLSGARRCGCGAMQRPQQLAVRV